MALTVIGVFDNATDAQQAVEQLVNDGFSRSNIDLSAQTSTYTGDTTDGELISDRHRNTSGTRTEEFVDDTKDVGSGIGGFFSSLFGDNDDRDKYERVANEGSVITVHAQNDDEAERAADILDDNGAVDVNERVASYGTDSLTTTPGVDSPSVDSPSVDSPSASMGTAFVDNDTRTTNGDQTIKVIEENLEVGKRTVETGGVRLRSRIIDKPVEESVRLREERVRVVRNPVSRPATAADLNAFQEGEISLTEHAEVAVVSKTAHVVEEISVGKEVTEREEVIRDTVRNTEVDVEQLGSTDQTIRTDRTGTDGDDVTYATK